MTEIHSSLLPLSVDIGKLTFLVNNPRQGDIEAVAKSYKQFGQRKPIVATKDNVVIAGNHQLAAARSLGWENIAVLYVDDDELTAKAFALADNRTSELGSYDDDLLAELLYEVSSIPDLMDSTGFSEKDLYDISATLDFNDVFDDFETGDRTTMFVRSFYFDDNDIDTLEKTISKYLQINDLSKNKENKTKALIEFCNYWNNDN